MWNKLEHLEVQEFFAELQRHRERFKEDWTPMARVGAHLKSSVRSAQLFAFISISRLIVTTCPSPDEGDEHFRLTVSWNPKKGKFAVDFASMNDGWLDQAAPQLVTESEVYPFLDEHLENLSAHLTSDGKFGKP